MSKGESIQWLICWIESYNELYVCVCMQTGGNGILYNTHNHIDLLVSMHVCTLKNGYVW